MICPACLQSTSDQANRCHSCGHELSLARAVGGIQDKLYVLRHTIQGLSSRLEEVNSELEGLRKLVQPPAATSQTYSKETEVPEKAEALPVALEAGMAAVANVREIPRTWDPLAAESAKGSRSASMAMDRETEINLGQKWLMIVGVLVTVLGVGFFLKYAFNRNWIGPAGRVALAYLAGMGCIGIGELFRRRQLAAFGLYLMGGGFAILYFAGFAAFHFYQLIGQTAAFLLMTVVTGLASGLALLFDTKWFAVLALLGGFLTPVVLSTGTDHQWALMLYMALLNGGILAIAMFKRWNLLNLLGLVCTWVLFTGWYLRHYNAEKFWLTLAFMNFFYLQYTIAPFLYYFARPGPVDLRGFWITLPNAMIALVYSLLMIPPRFSTEAAAIPCVAYSLAYFAMALHLHSKSRDENRESVFLCVAKGMMFLIIAVPILFSGPMITVMWCGQAWVLFWIGFRFRTSKFSIAALLLFASSIWKLVAYDYPMHFRITGRLAFSGGFETQMWERWITVGFVLTTLVHTAHRLRAMGHDGVAERQVARLMSIVSGVLLFLALNVETAAFFADHAPTARFAAISVLWAVYSIALILLGFWRNAAGLRHCAMALFAMTLLKVVLWDMAKVSTPFRILSFLVLGVMLIGASYLYHRFRGRLQAGRQAESPGPTADA